MAQHRNFMSIRTCIWPALAIFITVCSISKISANYIVRTYDTTANAHFNHLIVDNTTGVLYVSAENKLIRLSADLGLSNEKILGPEQDNPNCGPPGTQCDTSVNPKEDTSFIVKAMTVNYVDNTIIVCSNLYQGYCRKLQTSNLQDSGSDNYVTVTTNDPDASAVIFTGPGPSNSQVLYVGATLSTVGTSRLYQAYSVSMRRLDTFQLKLSSALDKSRISVEAQHAGTFLVDYIFGFSSAGFSYFITVQKESTQSQRYISKIARVCQNDDKFYSYAELPVECNKSGTNYNIAQAAYLGTAGNDLAEGISVTPKTEPVLYVLFANSQSNSKLTNSNSALCVYPLREIRQKIGENIKDCFEGIGNIGPDHLVTTKACSRISLPVNSWEAYCGRYNLNYPIGGTKAVSAQAVITFTDTITTAIAVAVTSRYTVAFIGTDNGSIRKVVLESKFLAKEYENITIDDGNKILPDLQFDKNKMFLYVLTKNKVTKMRLHDCFNRYKTCDTCLASKDPYCGWCSLESKCSLMTECTLFEEEKRWLSYSTQQCTAITSVSPQQVQIQQGKVTNLSLTISSLPTPSNGGGYVCVFKGYGDYTNTKLPTPATRRDDGILGVDCKTPMPYLLPPISTGQDHIVMKLSVKLDNQEFVSTNFTFFNCNKHTSCTSCTQSDFPCTWCIKKHICTNNQEDNCLDDTLVTGKNKQGNTERPGPESCPKIEKDDPEIRVPSGKTQVVSVKTKNLQSYQDEFRCKFLDTDRTVIAKKTGSGVIECDPDNPVPFSYDGQSPYQNVVFQVLWVNGAYVHPLDNPDNIQVKVYKCSAMGRSCGECLTVHPKFHCGWCGTQCSIQSQCNKNWLDSSSVCPNPTIESFTPKKGPISGGTMVTITGYNLGKNFSDIDNGVYVAEVPCKPIRELYEDAQKIVCITGRCDRCARNPPEDKKIRVIVAKKYDALSRDEFHYVEPMIKNIQPRLGPMSGGTNLTITGTGLDAGINVSATVGGQPCIILDRPSESKLICQTSPYYEYGPTSVKVNFDSHTTFATQRYDYKYDPNVTKVEPEKAIISGGIQITVTGTNLDTVQTPMIVIYNDSKQYTRGCNATSATQMICKSPGLPGNSSTIGEENLPIGLKYGFIMDGVLGLRDRSPRSFQIFANPEFDLFESGFKSFQVGTNEYLTINGKGLNLAVQKVDVVVKIGKSFCNVTSIAATQLTCVPPKEKPASLEQSADPEVEVIVGGSFSKRLGVLRYEEGGLSRAAIIGIAVAGGILFIIMIVGVLCFCIVYTRKSKANDRALKKMQTQMDVLEIRVAKECKEAFAELQTDMTEITSDLTGLVGIPFHDYRSFGMRVLFPSAEDYDHPVMREFQVEYSQQEGIEKGLRMFGQLVGNKTFLLLFVRTLESNKYFSMRDRVNVASLISVALQNKMEYHTDILKTLLADLIERSVEGRSHPKLLLRRTESVAEKMLTNWFTFLLYKFLRECAGEPLFMLFRAIKQQVDKGPVDAFTSEAKYSLSEDKLIRQQIDYKQLTLEVIDLDIQYVQYHPVKVLDCDTVSQVKEKILDAIYKNAPYSSRPYKEYLDLEWRNGERGRVILQDEDVTSRAEGDWKKVNTLAHYKVTDGAVMALIPRQSTEYNMTMLSDKSVASNKYPHYENTYFSGGSPALSRNVSPTTISLELEEKGLKYYHLVKQHDAEAQKEGDRGSKMVSEIYLTRLLATKGTLQQFVDDLFETIFSTAHRGSALPLAIKYMFDFLDDQALQHGIGDQEVVHTWKSNSLPLRFWVNVIKNPNFVFDVHKSNIVDSCLSVVAQTFMDSCSMSEHRLGKDSPSSKLLYAKDIPKYKKWVERYYQDIKLMPAISDQDMNAMLAEESRMHQGEFNSNAALYELYQYATKYNNELSSTLDEDEFARKNKLAGKLEQVHQNMASIV